MVENYTQSEEEAAVDYASAVLPGGTGGDEKVQREEPKTTVLEDEHGGLARRKAEDGKSPNERHTQRPSRFTHEREHSRNTELDRKSQYQTANNPYNKLTEIPPRPGYVQRWIRILQPYSNDYDGRNHHFKSHLGWRPRPLDTIPKEFRIPKGIMTEHNTEGVFRRGEQILMEMPKEQYEANREWAEEAVTELTMSVDEKLAASESDALPIERERRVVAAVGGAKRPRVADD